MKRLRKFVAMDPAERRLFLVSLVSMVVVRAALPFLPVHRIARIGNMLGRRWSSHQTSPVPVRRAALRIWQASRFCPASTCLSQSLAAHFVMSLLGFETMLRIGVSKEGGAFTAHAWLECPEQILIGEKSPDGRLFTPLPSLQRFFA